MEHNRAQWSIIGKILEHSAQKHNRQFEKHNRPKGNAFHFASFANHHQIAFTLIIYTQSLTSSLLLPKSFLYQVRSLVKWTYNHNTCNSDIFTNIITMYLLQQCIDCHEYKRYIMAKAHIKAKSIPLPYILYSGFL